MLQTEKGSFVPLVLTTSGGMGPGCKDMMKQLAQKIASKKDEKYADVVNHLRTRIRFALLRGVLIALTGERGKPTREINTNRDLYDVDMNLIPSARSYEPK